MVCDRRAAWPKVVARERHSSSTELNKIAAGFSLPRASIIEQCYAKLSFGLAVFS